MSLRIEGSDETPSVRCQRCNALGGRVHHGWGILCGRCIKADEDWLED